MRRTTILRFTAAILILIFSSREKAQESQKEKLRSADPEVFFANFALFCGQPTQNENSRVYSLPTTAAAEPLKIRFAGDRFRDCLLLWADFSSVI